MKALHLLPVPKRLTRRDGVCSLHREAILAGPEAPATTTVACALKEASGRRPRRVVDPDTRAAEAVVRLGLDKALPPQGYRLSIRRDDVRITGGDEAGLYYGAQTFHQLARQCGTQLPCLAIKDQPDFPVRGFYHDVARGKVPRLETLFDLVERMAHYKLNQLQLYVEHTFAFRGHADVWAGADPLTAGDILQLDEHCRCHHVDLVPSLSTFGHFCTFLKSPRLEHLNELPVRASRTPFSWTERLAHYTLDCSNPESLALVEELVAEYAPLFRSRLFNICCDETFDLGQGRNAARAARQGKGSLYLGFVKKIMRAVRREGKTPMLWGDILHHHPELVPALPRDAVVLNWDYSPDLLRGGSELFAAAGRRFYACPGVHGWRGWLNQVNDATGNILAQARAGRRHGAEGLLNTDWGDCGHVNFLSASYHGMILGAAAGWHTAAHHESKAAAFDRAFSVLEYRDPTGKLCRLLRRLGAAQVVDWKMMVQGLETSVGDALFASDAQVLNLSAAELRKLESAYTRVGRDRETLEQCLHAASPRDRLLPDEIRCGAEGVDLLLMAALAVHRAQGHRCRPTTRKVPPAAKVADDLRRFEERVGRLWHLRNRPSEYFRVRLALLDLARRVDATTGQGHRRKGEGTA